MKVLYRLKEAGFDAYIVGGSVRDLLLGFTPKDFDIATDARPEQVKQLFRNCLLIGRRFRLAHIRFGREIIEVATFRGEQKKKFSKHHRVAEHGMVLRDNIYGTLEEDARRRDFTVNALYYNITDFSLIDYCDGLADIKHKTLRLIGDPQQRYREDPVRLLRTIRFAGKLGFAIAPETAAPIIELAALLKHVPAARLYEEVLKLFHSGNAATIISLLRQYGLFTILFPQIASHLTPSAETLLELACESTDKRIRAGKPVSPAFLFACLLWQPLKDRINQLLADELPATLAQDKATHEIIAQQTKQLTIPRRFALMTREIWHFQQRLERRQAKYVWRILAHPRFRAAYDFLVLRATAGEPVQEQADWWTQLQAVDAATRQQMVEKLPKQAKRSKRDSK